MAKDFNNLSKKPPNYFVVFSRHPVVRRICVE